MRYLIATTATLALLVSGGAFATPIAGLYNTGVDNSGAVLAAGTADSHYSVTTIVATYPGGTPLILSGSAPFAAGAGGVIPQYGAPTGATGSWIPQQLNPSTPAISSWLTPLANQSQSLDPITNGNGDGIYVYQTSFNLSSNYSTATLSGQWAADNYGALYLNGKLISTIVNPRTVSQPDGVAYNDWTSFAAVSGSSYFHSGSNVLDFYVGNIAQDSGNPTGLRAEFTSSIAAVPEPDTYAMLLAGLGLMGFMVRRKKSA